VKLNVLLFASALALGATAAHAAPQFINGGFEAVATPFFSEPMTPANTPGWTIVYGDGGAPPALAQHLVQGHGEEGAQFAILGGPVFYNVMPALEQTIGGLAIGGHYAVSWLQSRDASTNTDGLVATLSGGATGGWTCQGNFGPTDINPDEFDNWLACQVDFVPTGSSVTFRFQSANVPGQPDVGFDAVSLFRQDAASAPEPAAWALMLGGFGLAGAALRRRRALAA
jgi:hypothetical protein